MNHEDRTLKKAIGQKTLNFIESFSNESLRLGSLAWWGSALVRRGSRVQIPPEAPHS